MAVLYATSADGGFQSLLLHKLADVPVATAAQNGCVAVARQSALVGDFILQLDKRGTFVQESESQRTEAMAAFRQQLNRAVNAEKARISPATSTLSAESAGTLADYYQGSFSAVRLWLRTSGVWNKLHLFVDERSPAAQLV